MFQLIVMFILAGLLAESTQQTVDPPEPCLLLADTRCWTQWFDRDDPTGTGDWESLTILRDEHPNKICPMPIGMEVVTADGVSVAAAGQVIFANDTTTGFICKNEDQPDNQCLDYRVRFGCHPPFCDRHTCWTKWFDRDDPSYSGDWEDLDALRKQHPGAICEEPTYVEAVTVNNSAPALSTGQNFFYYDPTTGFACRNADQEKGMCLDYKVRFGCPC